MADMRLPWTLADVEEKATKADRKQEKETAKHADMPVMNDWEVYKSQVTTND